MDRQATALYLYRQILKHRSLQQDLCLVADKIHSAKILSPHFIVSFVVFDIAFRIRSTSFLFSKGAAKRTQLDIFREALPTFRQANRIKYSTSAFLQSHNDNGGQKELLTCGAGSKLVCSCWDQPLSLRRAVEVETLSSCSICISA